MFDSRFLQIVAPLRVPLAGTELIAPFLYSLVRSTRPRRLVEAGTGYTTPFLIQAIADNLADFTHESEQLKKKSEQLVGAPAREASAAELRWLSAEPAGADPGFYLDEYAPRLYAFDDFSDTDGSAPRVLEVVKELGLRHLLTFIQGDPCLHSHEIDPRDLPIDFAWNDADRYEDFIATYWDLVNPDGGLILLHNTTNSWAGNARVVKNLKERQATSRNEFELVSFVEPHKLMQRSFTILRKISGFKESYLENRREEIQENIARFLRVSR